MLFPFLLRQGFARLPCCCFAPPPLVGKVHHPSICLILGGSNSTGRTGRWYHGLVFDRGRSRGCKAHLVRLRPSYSYLSAPSQECELGRMQPCSQHQTACQNSSSFESSSLSPCVCGAFLAVPTKSVKATIYLTLRRDKRAYAQCYRDMAQANPSAATYILLGEAYMRIQMPEVSRTHTVLPTGPKQGSCGDGVRHVGRTISHNSTVCSCRRRSDDRSRCTNEKPGRLSPFRFEGISQHSFRLLSAFRPPESPTFVPMHKPITWVPTQAAIESFEIALDTDPSDSTLAGQVRLRLRPTYSTYVFSPLSRQRCSLGKHRSTTID